MYEFYTANTQLLFSIRLLKATFDRSSSNGIWCNNLWICVSAFHRSVKMGEGVSFDVVDRTCLWQCHQTAANKQSHMGVLSCLIYFLDWMWEQLQLCRVSTPTLWTSKFYTSSQNAWRPHRDFILYLLFPGHPIGVQVKSKTSRHPTSVNNSFTKPQSLKIGVSGGVRGSVIRDSTLFSRLQYIYTDTWHPSPIYLGLRNFPDLMNRSTLAAMNCYWRVRFVVHFGNQYTSICTIGLNLDRMVSVHTQVSTPRQPLNVVWTMTMTTIAGWRLPYRRVRLSNTCMGATAQGESNENPSGAKGMERQWNWYSNDTPTKAHLLSSIQYIMYVSVVWCTSFSVPDAVSNYTIQFHWFSWHSGHLKL